MFNRAYVEITNVCNLHCDFCPGTARPAGFMTVADFAAAAAALRPYTDYLYLHVMGEPLLHPHLEDVLKTADEQGPGAAGRPCPAQGQRVPPLL